jgi:nicotinamide phosphoribosyltransferase
MLNNNIILQTDSYKMSHWKQYPPGTEHVYSYFESRGGAYDKVLFFGLQYFLKEYLAGSLLSYVKLGQGADFAEKHFGNKDIFNTQGWIHIIEAHDGKLPIEIKAVPEGTLVDTRNVLFTVENTCPQCFWLTSYLETLLEQVWYPTTVATKSYHMKQIIKQALKKTGNDIADFKLHDFGYRGSTSQESAGLGGAAHLVNFQGSDTIAAITLLQQYYGADMPAFSIPAAEHSTITAWGKWGEADAYRNMLTQFPKGLVAVVSDSYDIYNACKKLWGKELIDLVQQRVGVLVIRPDSGDARVVLPKILDILAEKFNFSVNQKGYKVLPPYLRLIQGDGIDEQSLRGILATLEGNGWSADNIAFGSGGGLLQQVNRDTCKFAYKCSNVTINGQDIPVSKDPITDPGKRSKAGRLGLAKTELGCMTMNSFQSQVWEKENILQPVFKDGELLIDQSFEEIRARAI